MNIFCNNIDLSKHPSPSKEEKPETNNEVVQELPTIQRRPRAGGSTTKTAEVWQYFTERPNGEKAATCNICGKIIKATNSSTTGMIRHLRSCHHTEYQDLQHQRTLKALKNAADDSMREQLRRELGVLQNNNPRLLLRDGEENGGNFISRRAVNNIQNLPLINQQNLLQQNQFIPKQHFVETLLNAAKISPTNSESLRSSPVNIRTTTTINEVYSASSYSPNISLGSAGSNNSSGIGNSSSSDCWSNDNNNTSCISSLASPPIEGKAAMAPINYGQAINPCGNVNLGNNPILSTVLLSTIAAMIRNNQAQNLQQKLTQNFQQNITSNINSFSIPTTPTTSAQNCNNSENIKRKGTIVNGILQKLSNKATAEAYNLFPSQQLKIPVEIKKEIEDLNNGNNINNKLIIKKIKKKESKTKRSFVNVQTQTDNEETEMKKCNCNSQFNINNEEKTKENDDRGITLIDMEKQH
ncbi:BED-type domain-containing protein [Meloidogyne graminicola]|uniref:BED-type domain-containing protein n=1 Tax=Meloidogyne graminicola TaxID=189291 RepID=A0A8S9ZXV2_9BILA|nr:BED-type domain-containing protein [Meloidogyne graminicola]